MKSTPMVTPKTLSLPTVIHAVEETVSVRTVDGADSDWKFSLVFAGDYSCRLFACPEGEPSGGKLVTTMFSSLADMRDSLDEWLAKVGLPDTVADAIAAAAPEFLADAEIAYHTSQYLQRPD